MVKRVHSAAGLALLVVAALAGCGSPATVTAGPSGTSSMTVTPSDTGPAPLAEIPDAAMLQPEDLGPGGAMPGPADRPAFDVLFTPCRVYAPKADSLKVARKWVMGVHRLDGNLNETAGTVYHVVTSYRADGAEAYVSEVRESMVRCGVIVEASGRAESTIVAENFGGDESMLYTHTLSGIGSDGRPWTDIQYATVVGIGSVAIIVYHWGVWHNDAQESVRSVARQYVDHFVQAALRRAAVLH